MRIIQMIAYRNHFRAFGHEAGDHFADPKIQQAGRAAHPDDASRLGAHTLNRFLRRAGFDQYGVR